MFLDKKIIAVVPARGGSKGIIKKNIKNLLGKPLIEYTLDTAKTVGQIDCLVVSTDDKEIAEIAKNNSVKVIDRPSDIASDGSSTEECLIHVLEWLENFENEIFDIILVLEPTSPLRSKDTIIGAIQMIYDGFDSVLAVKETTENIGTIEEGSFKTIIKNAPRQRQLRQKFYIESSTIYAADVNFLRTNHSLVSENWGALVVTNRESNDINTIDDFNYIKFLMKGDLNE